MTMVESSHSLPSHHCTLCHRKLSAQQKELIVEYAKIENLSSGSVDGISFESPNEGQFKGHDGLLMATKNVGVVLYIRSPVFGIVYGTYALNNWYFFDVASQSFDVSQTPPTHNA